MTPDAAVEALERATTRARARAIVRGTPECSAAYFARVLRLFSEDHAALGRLGRWARLVAREGDDAALGLRALGVVERVGGRWRASARAFVAAGETATDPIDRLAFQRGAVDSLARAGCVEEAVALARRLERSLMRLDQPLLAARVRMNLGTALLSQDRSHEARRALRGVPEMLLAHGDPNESAAARLALSTSHLFGGDPRAARSEAEGTIEAADRLGLGYLGDLARLNLAQTDLRRGRPDLALAGLVPLRASLAETPVDAIRVVEFLGDAYLRLNLWPEAVEAYRQAIATGTETGATIPLHRGHARHGLGQSLARLGRLDEARRELAAAARLYGRLGNVGWEAAARTSLVEIDAVPDRRRSRAAIAAARRARSGYHLARALLASGGGEEIEEAARIIDRGHEPTLRWRVHARRAELAPGEGRDPLPHHRRAFRAMLAERRRLSSVVSRAGALRDKSDALSRYVAALLDDPRPARVREALSVVTRSRSATLLEEIVSAMPRTFLPSLEALREGLTVEEPFADGDGPSARRGHRIGAGGRLRREWIEATAPLFAGPTRLQARSDGAVLVRAGDALFALGRGAAVPLESAGVESRLEWLDYDLLAPMAEPDADPAPALAELRRLGGELLPLWAQGVCPDGAFWRVPWAACAAALGRPEIEVRLHPAFRAGEISPGATMLWIGAHHDLPHVREETDAFLARFPAARICRTAAETRAALHEGGSVAILHVAGHARHRRANPMFSTVDFEDGALTAAEIARSPLSIGFAALSACETGRVSDANAHEPDGLVRAVLARGASAAIGSAWPLDDAAGTLFARALYEGIASGCPLRRALGEARALVRKTLPHPYYWGSPTLFAGYRP